MKPDLGALPSEPGGAQLVSASVVPDPSKSRNPVGNGNYDSYKARSRVSDDLAKEVCRVIGRRRNSGGP